MRHLVALVLLGLVTGCGGSTPAEPAPSTSDTSSTVSRAVVGSTSGWISFPADWKAPFTGDHSRHQRVGCVRDLVVRGVRLDVDLAVDGPDGASWDCAGVVESVDWSGAGPISLAAYVSTESAHRVQVAIRTESFQR